MRIISKFSDYYDGLQEHDGSMFIRDEVCHNLSNSTIFKLEELFRDMPFRLDERSIECDKALIFFCGAVYPVFYIRKRNTLGKIVKVYCVQNPQDMVEILNEKFNYRNRDKRVYYHFFNRSFDFTHKGITDYMRYIDTHQKFIMNTFYEIGKPVFIIHRDYHVYPYKNDVKINSGIPLKDFGFQSIINPFDAYQRIKHFVSNDLVYDPLNDFKMSDELKRDSKGFDKYSFKKVKKV